MQVVALRPGIFQGYVTIKDKIIESLFYGPHMQACLTEVYMQSYSSVCDNIQILKVKFDYIITQYFVAWSEGYKS